MHKVLAKLAEPAAGATIVALALGGFILAEYVLPVYQEMYAGAAWVLPAPTRLAMGAGRPGILVGLLFIVIIVAAWKFRGPEGAAARLAVVGLANLLLALWLIGLAWVALDYARRVPALGEAAVRAGPPAAVQSAAPDSAKR